ncbi:MAG: branched-chain amino acid ABC transporter ATP-binding protein/permease [Chloroflexi bacterium]|nr:branched-chain amino acid ABC transporter ATP-binding protein/permease [Chloroflexota bacterium]
MQYAQAIFTNAAIYAIATVGLAIFTGYTGLFSLGHAAFMALGAYTTAILTHFLGWPFIPALLAGMTVAMLASAIIGYPTLRAKLRSDYFAIATLGFGEAVKVLLENLALTQGARGLPGLHKFADPLNTGLFLILVIWLSRNFLKSTYGRNAIAIGQDPVAAEMIGIRLLPNKMLSLAISAAFAGLAGGLLAHYLTFIQPSIFSMDLSGLLTAGVVAGGMGSLTGPIVAVALFVVIPELFRGLALWRLVLYGVVLVVIINYRPKGLFGYEELSVANLPKLLLIVGVTVALTVGVGIYNEFGDYWGTVPAVLVAVAAGAGVVALSIALGRGWTRVVGPALVQRRWGAGEKGSRGAEERVASPSPRHPAPQHLGAPIPLLAISGLRKSFGGITAVNGVDLAVRPGEIVGLIGPNGSGKTTVFNLISGVYRADGGSVRLEGRELLGTAPDRIVGSGISRTFQNIRLFSKMTVLQNVQTALHPLSSYSLPEAFLRWPWTVPQAETRLQNAALELLDVMGLREHAGQVAGALPYGLQRKLEIARALALQPKLLLLDEPAAGMNPEESLELVELIERMRAKYNLAVILIEHHMDVVMNLCSRITVLNFGGVIAEGAPDEIQANPVVLKAYLGEKEA